MKIQGLKDLNDFIEKEIMPNQLKYGLYLVGGTIALLFGIWWMGR